MNALAASLVAASTEASPGAKPSATIAKRDDVAGRVSIDFGCPTCGAPMNLKAFSMREKSLRRLLARLGEPAEAAINGRTWPRKGLSEPGSGLLNAVRLDQKLDEATSVLDTTPMRCRIVPELRAEGLSAYRELIVRPYRIVFRIYGKDVVLLAVLDGRRDLAELLLERTLDA